MVAGARLAAMSFAHYLSAFFIVAAAGCTAVVPAFAQRGDVGDQPGYVPTQDEEELPPEYRHQVVFFRSNEAPGTIVVHTAERFLYIVQGNSRALRYGIGVGRDGFQWQ